MLVGIAGLSVLLTGCAGTFNSTVGTGSFIFGLFYFFLLIIWFTLLIRIFGDIFYREDLSGWAKGGWIALVFIVPLIGILIYVIARPRDLPQDKRVAAEYDAAAARVSGGSAVDDIAKAAELRDSGALTEEEFQKIKGQALT